jgi:hypothetical protein
MSAPLGGVLGSGRKPGGARCAPSKRCSRQLDDRNVTHHERRGNTNMTSPGAPGLRGGGTPRGSGERKEAPRPGKGAGSSGSAGAAAGASARASGTSTRRPEAQSRKEEASTGQVEGMAGGEEGVEKKQKEGSARPSSNPAPTCRVQVVARRPLQGRAVTGERVIGVTREDSGPAVAPEGGSVRWPGQQAQVEAGGCLQVRVGQGDGGGGGHGFQPDGILSAYTGVKVSPELGAFERGRSRG